MSTGQGIAIVGGVALVGLALWYAQKQAELASKASRRSAWESLGGLAEAGYRWIT